MKKYKPFQDHNLQHTVIKTSVSALTGQQAEEPPHNIELEEII